MAYTAYWIEDDPRIDDLSSETIIGVADRLLTSHSFEELVYRECELDALWTLADIAVLVESLERTGRVMTPPETLGDAGATKLARLRALVFEAHELATEADVEGASKLLHEAAAIAPTGS